MHTYSRRRTRAYAAPIAMLSHFRALLGDVKSREEPDSPDSAICIRALAQRRSSRMYRRLVRAAKSEGGMRAKRGSSRGACEDNIRCCVCMLLSRCNHLVVDAAIVR